MDQLIVQGNRHGGPSTNTFSSTNKLGVIYDQGTQTELDHLEVDEEDY